MKKGITGKSVIVEMITSFSAMVILTRCYLIYKVVWGLKAHFLDWGHYGDVPIFFGDTGSRGMSKAARQYRYVGMIKFYGVSGTADPDCVNALGPELASKVKLVALPYTKVLDYVRMRLIEPSNKISIWWYGKGTPFVANMCLKTKDFYYVVYDSTAKLSKFYFYHELGHVLDNLEHGEWPANKFALDNVEYNAEEDLFSSYTDAVSWCEHLSGTKLSEFEKGILADYIYICRDFDIKQFLKYLNTKNVDYLKAIDAEFGYGEAEP